MEGLNGGRHIDKQHCWLYFIDDSNYRRLVNFLLFLAQSILWRFAIFIFTGNRSSNYFAVPFRTQSYLPKTIKNARRYIDHESFFRWKESSFPHRNELEREFRFKWVHRHYDTSSVYEVTPSIIHWDTDKIQLFPFLFDLTYRYMWNEILEQLFRTTNTNWLSMKLRLHF